MSWKRVGSKLTKSGVVTLHELAQEIREKVRVQSASVRGSRVEIRRDGLRGCMASIKQSGSQTEVSIGGPFVPSTGLSVLMSVPCSGGAFAVMLFVNLFLGIALLVLSTFIRFLPSVGLVSEIKAGLTRP